MGRFCDVEGESPARVVIEQTSDTTFLLCAGFRYRNEEECLDFIVLPADLPTTDLATVPWFLRWFVPAYGRHSLAALLHDHLLENGHRLTPAVPRVRADEIFLLALRDLEVPRLRRHLMAAAVSIQTRLDRGGWSRRRMLFWLLASFLGTATLLGAIVSGEGLLALGALFAPLLGSLLWWPQLGKGLVAGYGSAILGPPSFAVAVAYAAYWLGEMVLRVFSRDSDTAAPVGRPDLDL